MPAAWEMRGMYYGTSGRRDFDGLHGRLVAAEKFDGMDAKEFEQMLRHYQKRADPAAEKK